MTEDKIEIERVEEFADELSDEALDRDMKSSMSQGAATLN